MYSDNVNFSSPFFASIYYACLLEMYVPDTYIVLLWWYTYC